MDHHTDAAPSRTGIGISLRDLPSNYQVLWKESRETAEVTIEQLRQEFEENGAPLVLKADGGPAFRSEEFHALMDEHQVELLPSPYYCPQYNGSCEAANNSMKKRTAQIAALAGHANQWLPWDLELARLQANRLARPWGVNGSNPQGVWDTREAATAAQRAAFQATCQQFREQVTVDYELSEEDLGTETVARCVQRVAVSRALVAHGYLTVQRKVIRPPIRTRKTA